MIDGSSLNPMSAMRPRHLHRRTVWEYSPTCRKYWERKRLNRGAQSLTNCVTGPPLLLGPNYTRWLSICEPRCHVAPLTGVRVASCHASAPPAPRVGQPWLYHMASVPRRIHALVPRATSSSAGNKSPFSRFQ